jgi:hypothetical protein
MSREAVTAKTSSLGKVWVSISRDSELEAELVLSI